MLCGAGGGPGIGDSPDRTLRHGQTGPVRIDPVTPSEVVRRLSERIHADLTTARTADPSRRWRILLDGAPPTGTAELADRLVEPLRAAGHPVARVAARDFSRPASIRWEYGREDPDVLYDLGLDAGALVREVLDPLGPGGTGEFLPALWDVDRDRSARARRLPTEPGTVLLLAGDLLLGRGLPADLTVHLAMRPDMLARRTDPADAWRLPADERYRHEVDPERVADQVVRVDHADRPGWVGSVR